MLKTSGAMFLMLALAVSNGCAHDDDEPTTASTTSTSGSDDDAADRRAARAEHDDDVDHSNDASARREARQDERQAEAATPPPAAATPAASSSTSSSDGARASNDTNQGATPAASGNVPTAQDQPVGNTDEDITVHIRQAVVADDSLSMAARNITIVTRSGVVTLRGSLSQADERSAIERHARAAPGVRRVDNRISVRN